MHTINDILERLERGQSERAIARLVQRGIRQARYRGINKTLFQALMAAAVVNLTLIAGLTGALWSLCVGLLPLVLAFWAVRVPCAPRPFDESPYRPRPVSLASIS